MRIVFCGTPEFAVPTLQHLLGLPELEIAAVITQPDRPRGRGHEISAPPVKQAALAAGLPVHQPAKIRSQEALELVARLALDAVVIIAYGQIIPAALLAIPRHGWINLHASLLPKYRGAAPINWALVHGESVSGLTTMRIDAGMDTGEILLKQRMEIGPAETAPALAARMAQAGAPLMAQTLRRLRDASITPRAQNPAEATYAPLLKREDGRIRWDLAAQEIFNRIRGFDPWPGAFTTFRGQLCHIWGAPLAGASSATPGHILRSGANVHVACGGGTLLRLDGVKLEGRRRITAQEFADGAPLAAGDSFEPAPHA